MTNHELKVVHYLNQFFGQINGEDKTYTEPLSKAGPIGPGMFFQQLLAQEVEIIGTVICGDSYFNEHRETAMEMIITLIKRYDPDLLLAGPSFNAGRYGIS